MAELADMKLFVTAINRGSLSAAGRELGLSPAVASKRLSRLEANLGARLVQRTSRQLRLTEEGAAYHERCQAILSDVEEAENIVHQGRATPSGVLHISSPVALGRRWVGSALTEFARQYPDVQVRLCLSDALLDLVDQGFDCAIRIGGPEDSQLIARKLADNCRVVCAAPDYVKHYGLPQSLMDLSTHHAIHLGSHFVSHTHWNLINASCRSETHTARVPVRFVTDNGEQAHEWALAGLGLIRRSIWDVAHDLATGALVEVLPDWTGEQAPLQIVFPSRRFLPARTRLFIDFLVNDFQRRFQPLPSIQ